MDFRSEYMLTCSIISNGDIQLYKQHHSQTQGYYSQGYYSLVYSQGHSTPRTHVQTGLSVYCLKYQGGMSPCIWTPIVFTCQDYQSTRTHLLIFHVHLTNTYVHMYIYSEISPMYTYKSCTQIKFLIPPISHLLSHFLKNVMYSSEIISKRKDTTLSCTDRVIQLLVHMYRPDSPSTVSNIKGKCSHAHGHLLYSPVKTTN
ncbi:hypothetical protein YC2023_066944 [Brassica napus]